MVNKFVFNRQTLAKSYCDSLEGKGIANNTSGLFLAGPRRVGKSTFLLRDLMPEVAARHWLSIYVDLWAEKAADPALLIIEMIKTAMLSVSGGLKKVTRKVQVKKITVLGAVEIDFSKPGLPKSVTLVQLLEHLIAASKKPVVLIIDEAQHALSTKAGLDAMFSIKSARDQINLRGEMPKLMLVFTGSNRDKLAQLLIKKDKPFFGSEVTAFPLLGRDYTDFFTDEVNKSLSANNQFSQADMWEAFQLVGYKPEILRQIAGRVAISNEAQSLSDLLKKDAFIWHDQLWQDYANDYEALTELQKAVLCLLIEKGRAWSPFSEEAMGFYRDKLGEPAKTPSVQTAIQALRDKGFIWQSGRGCYALEDEGFVEWFKYHEKSRA